MVHAPPSGASFFRMHSSIRRFVLRLHCFLHQQVHRRLYCNRMQASWLHVKIRGSLGELVEQTYFLGCAR